MKLMSLYVAVCWVKFHPAVLPSSRALATLMLLMLPPAGPPDVSIIRTFHPAGAGVGGASASKPAPRRPESQLASLNVSLCQSVPSEAFVGTSAFIDETGVTSGSVS